QGFNSRLDELQAAFLRVKLKKLDEWNVRRAMVAQSYLENLAEVPSLTLPHVPSWAEPVWHLFVIRSEERDKLADRLKENGIQTLIHYPIPPHLSEAYQINTFLKINLLRTEQIATQVLSLPMDPFLSQCQIRYMFKLFNSLPC
ncbi:MAG: DegT/DnrJ/EryC1/StrS family aminotransferase, partial [Snowella sp.]|nr:DegT/DnrJ/EryC1/StrS family aminotransferase [Snowella sp.]